MKVNKLMLGLVAGCLGVITSQAVPMYDYTDHDILNAPLGPGGDPSVSGEFNIATGDGDFLDVPGYDPVTQTITDAYASFSLVSNSSEETMVSIDLGDLFGQYLVGFHFTTIGGAVGGLALADLDADGIVAYSIQWLSGAPFIASDAIISARATDRPTDVPDGGATVGLLGLGLAALGFTARKRNA